MGSNKSGSPNTSRLSGPDGTGGPHVFVDDLANPQLSDDDRHHLAKALRTRAGDPFTVSDGAGGWRACRFGTSIEVAGDINTVEGPAYEIGVGFVLVKGARPELATQKLTELGVDRITFLHAEHSVVRWDGPKAEKNLERLRRVAREAAMQSRRVWLPHLAGVSTIDTVIGAAPGVVMAEPGGRRFDGSERLVVVGPEGGWSERELSRAMPGSTVTLGSQILRAETAAIVAGTVLSHLRDGLVTPTHPS